MVPPGEILDDTSVVTNGTSAVCESRNLVRDNSIRSIRLEDMEPELCGKADNQLDITCIIMEDPAKGKAESTGNTNHNITSDKYSNMPPDSTHSILLKPNNGDSVGNKCLLFGAPVSPAECFFMTESVWPKMVAESMAIALEQKKASEVDVDKILEPEPLKPFDAGCATRSRDIVEWIRHQVRHRIIGLGVRISKLLSDVRPALNFLPNHAHVPTIADAFMLGSADTVNNDFDARKFKVAPFAGNPNDYQRFVRDAMDYLGSCFGNHQDEEYSLGDEAEGKSPYGYIEQDPLDTSFFFSGMAAALPLPGAAAPAGGHPPGTPPNAQRVALLSRANRRKKTLAAFLTAHVTDQNLKTMLQNQAAGDGGRMWQLLRQHCYRPINDLTMHDLKDKISSVSFDSVEIGRSADSLNRLVQVLNNLNHQLPAANRFTESEMVEKVLRCISSLGNTPLAHDARQELAADVTERRFWLPANAGTGVAAHRSMIVLLEKLEPLWRSTHAANGIPRRRDAGANQRADVHLVDGEDEDAFAAGTVRGRRDGGRTGRVARPPVRKPPVSDSVMKDLVICFCCRGFGHPASVCPSSSKLNGCCVTVPQAIERLTLAQSSGAAAGTFGRGDARAVDDAAFETEENGNDLAESPSGADAVDVFDPDYYQGDADAVETMPSAAGVHASLPAAEELAGSVKVFAANDSSIECDDLLLGGSGAECCESAEQLLLLHDVDASRRWIALGLTATAAAAAAAAAAVKRAF